MDDALVPKRIGRPPGSKNKPKPKEQEELREQRRLDRVRKRSKKAVVRRRHREKMQKYRWEKSFAHRVAAAGPVPFDTLPEEMKKELIQQSRKPGKYVHIGNVKSLKKVITSAAAKQFFREFLNSPEYRMSAVKRVLAGKAQHLEILWHHLAFGKPKEEVDINVQQLTGLVIKIDPNYTPDNILSEALNEASRMGEGSQPLLPGTASPVQPDTIVVSGEQPPAGGVSEEPEEVRAPVRNRGGWEDAGAASEAAS